MQNNAELESYIILIRVKQSFHISFKSLVNKIFDSELEYHRLKFLFNLLSIRFFTLLADLTSKPSFTNIMKISRNDWLKEISKWLTKKLNSLDITFYSNSWKSQTTFVAYIECNT